MKSVSREFAAESFEDMGLWISELQDAIERCQMKVYIYICICTCIYICTYIYIGKYIYVCIYGAMDQRTSGCN
jgi:hypothetical protein